MLVTGLSRYFSFVLFGKTENMRQVNVAAPARLVGQFVDVAITEALPNSLRGRVVTADAT